MIGSRNVVAQFACHVLGWSARMTDDLIVSTTTLPMFLLSIRAAMPRPKDTDLTTTSSAVLSFFKLIRIKEPNMETAITVAIIAAAISVLGWLVNYVLSSRSERERARLASQLSHVQKQLEPLYGPLAFLIYEGRQTFSDLREKLGPRPFFGGGRSLSDEELVLCRPVLARAGPGRHRLQPGPPLPRIPASVTPSARESTSHWPVAWPMPRRQRGFPETGSNRSPGRSLPGAASRT